MAPAPGDRVSTPAVSVVLATRNQARWLADTIASVQAQTVSDWELVIVDDGSTDDTPAVAARFGGDHRIRYLRGAHRERAVARNWGVATATAPLLAFLDGDDRWHPRKLAAQRAALTAAPAAPLCYTVARFVDPQGRFLGHCKPSRLERGDVFAALARANFLILSSVVVRRAAFERAGGFDEGLAPLGCEDWDLWLRLALQGPVVAVPEPLTDYRVHGANTAREQVLQSALTVIDKLFADPTLGARTGTSRAAVRARHLWYHAASLAASSSHEARRTAATALREAPASLFTRAALGALGALVGARVNRRALR